jgi:3-hydroxybutyryl-CoA dehydrogenase
MNGRVLMVGAGLMGTQIACEYAIGGYDVTAVARDEPALRGRIEETLGMLVELGLTDAAAAAAARDRLAATNGEPWTATDFDLVVESLPEDLGVKSAVLGPIAARLPGAIIASNTSSLSITELGEAIGAPARTLGTHYWNPPLLMPPVEVILGAGTDPEQAERVIAILRTLGKEPMLVERDVPGFVWNRLLHALLRESLWLVHNDIATPETVDAIVKSGLARRARLTGVFDTVALGGAETWRQVAENLFPELSTAVSPGELAPYAGMSDDERAAVLRARNQALAHQLRNERGMKEAQ